jgi:hypothetical protein
MRNVAPAPQDRLCLRGWGRVFNRCAVEGRSADISHQRTKPLVGRVSVQSFVPDQLVQQLLCLERQVAHHQLTLICNGAPRSVEEAKWDAGKKVALCGNPQRISKMIDDGNDRSCPPRQAEPAVHKPQFQTGWGCQNVRRSGELIEAQRLRQSRKFFDLSTKSWS